MEKIRWCLETKDGIKIIEPNDNLAQAYLFKSENALAAASTLKENQDWAISAYYYAMYFSLYALLMKIGVKCEIHSCTLIFMKRFLTPYFKPEEAVLLEESLQARINAQYYVDRPVAELQYQTIKRQAPVFITHCKEILRQITEKEIEQIRTELNKLQKE